jgi:flagellar biosynthesis anti-sigma factor FlgM
MKIELNSPAANQLPVDRSVKQVSTSDTTAAQSVTVDRTTFHSDSLSVQSLTSQAMNSPEIRQDKVAAFQQSISSGEYKPDASKTADAIASSNGQ